MTLGVRWLSLLKERPEKRLGCQLWITDTLSDWANECLSPGVGILVSHYSIHYCSYPLTQSAVHKISVYHFCNPVGV